MIRRTIKWLMRDRDLPEAAKLARVDDRRGRGADPGTEAVRDAVIEWLILAQDGAVPSDGGVARDFCLRSERWNASYPETTGYVVPTFLALAKRTGRKDLRTRARRMLDWLVSIQLEGGGFQGGTIGAEPLVPVAFNTGQILIGLAEGCRELGDEYVTAARRAAGWLVEIQDPDGCWRRGASPFAGPGDHAYDTHVAWGLYEAYGVLREQDVAGAATANVRWAIGHQAENGWFDHCCLVDPARPLTHTIGYALRGVIEAFRATGDEVFLDAALRTANGLLDVIDDDGYIPGRLDRSWGKAAEWSCLTGSAQIACCWFLLTALTSDERYADAARRANRYVRSTVAIDGRPGVAGGVRGSFPIDGGYNPYRYLNWAAKFLLDSLIFEEDA